MKAICGCTEDWICRLCLKCAACCPCGNYFAIHRNSVEASQRWRTMMREAVPKSTGAAS